MGRPGPSCQQREEDTQQLTTQNQSSFLFVVLRILTPPTPPSLKLIFCFPISPDVVLLEF